MLSSTMVYVLEPYPTFLQQMLLLLSITPSENRIKRQKMNSDQCSGFAYSQIISPLLKLGIEKKGFCQMEKWGEDRIGVDEGKGRQSARV